MNQVPNNLNDTCQSPSNEEKPKSSFLPSNYYFEKDNFSQGKQMNYMPSQYYNFQQSNEISKEIQNSEKKTFVKPSNLPNCQQNPFNITNNISISNYSISETQKQDVNYEIQRQNPNYFRAEEGRRGPSKNPSQSQVFQQGFQDSNGRSSFPTETNEKSVEGVGVSQGSKNIKKFGRNQSIISQNFGYLNDDEGDDGGNDQVKLHPQNFFKTKLCPHFLQGNCNRGKKCKFSHSEGELRRMPDLRRTKICQLYMMGRCHMGPNCTFAHGEEELRTHVDFYKTMICKAFRNGFCPKGQHCNYAHGEQDLRAPTFYDHDALIMKSVPNYREKEDIPMNFMVTGDFQSKQEGEQDPEENTPVIDNKYDEEPKKEIKN